MLELNPRAVPAQLRLSELSLSTGSADLAVQFASQAVKRDPKRLDARLALIRGLVARGDLDSADREMVTLMAQFPKVAAVHNVSGVIHAQRGRFSAARDAFERALTQEPRSGEALKGLIALDAHENNVPRARARVERLLEKSPDDPGLLLISAQVSALAGDWSRSEAVLKRVIELDPRNLTAYGALGRVYITQGKLDQAREEFATLAGRDPASVSAPTMVATILHQQNRLSDAVTWYERALKVDSRAAVAANNLAWLYAEGHGNATNALRLAQVAAEELPDNADVSDTLGWVYYKQGLSALAIAPLSRSIQLAPQNPVYHFHLGLAYAKDGRKDAARDALQRALKLKPNFEGAVEARRVLDALEVGLGLVSVFRSGRKSPKWGLLRATFATIFDIFP